MDGLSLHSPTLSTQKHYMLLKRILFPSSLKLKPAPFSVANRINNNRINHHRMSTTLTPILYAHQTALPKLPVPSLEETATRFLESIRPLATPEEFKNSQKALSDFVSPQGLGPILHQRLLERRDQMALTKEGKSWLIDWWNDYAYMGYRDPVVIYVNYFFAFSDDKTRMNPSSRAASIVRAALEFRDLVISGDLTPESTKAGPLCSEQYKYLFNATRIPQIPSDTTRLSDPSKNSHIVVLRKNQFFKLDLEVPGRGRLSVEEIQHQLDIIYEIAGKEPESPIGALTTENRDVWTKARDELMEFSPVNRESFDIIETAAFALCLDDSKPVTKDEHSAACWHGDGRNRFFDKSMQFIVFDNGKAGFNGEHSNMEATITHRACDWICEGLANNTINLGAGSGISREHSNAGSFEASTNSSSSQLDPPRKLDFQLNARACTLIQKATQNFDELAGKHDLRVVTYEAYGKNTIKKLGVSPDAYAQMAIQLAYFKMYGVSRATYESAGTRKFRHGRTETGRSVSVESVAWVKAMQDPYISIHEKGKLGRKAIASQSSFMAAAGDGRGVDRHFLGLRLLLKEGEQKPAIYSDPVFIRSSHWNLSTSQVTSEFYDGYGWGEVVSDGYGVAYMVKNNSLQFNLVSQKLNNHHFQTYFHEALSEMRVVFEATAPPAKAKL